MSLLDRLPPEPAGPPALPSTAWDVRLLDQAPAGCPVFPFDLASASVSVEAFRLWLGWMRWRGRSFRPEGLPWLPIGRVGPVPVLGHCRLGATGEAAPVPWGWFQAVLLTRADYERQLQAVALAVSGLGAAGLDVSQPETDPDRLGALGRPQSLPEAIERLARCFVLEPGDRLEARRLSSLRNPTWADLPPGWREAVWFLLGRGPVVDPTVLREAEGLRRRVPADLAGRVAAVAEAADRLYVRTCDIERAELEDRLLLHLGEEGRRIHFLLEPQTSTGASAGGAEAPPAADRWLAGGRAEAGADDVVLDLNPARWEAFDPRSVRAEPRDVFCWLLHRAVALAASDLHLEPGLELARARVRLDGDLSEILAMPDSFGRQVVAAGKSLLGMRSELFDPQDHGCAIKVGPETINLRISALPIRRCYQKLVLRLLPRRARALRLDHLVTEPRLLRLIRRAISRPQGLILVCGPTGSGKTTTLFACLAELNRASRNVVTAEDPVEYEIEGLNQAAVDRPRGVGWDRLLEAMLRQDPDVMLIGEIRSRETAEIAVQAALSGHLVFATLHTLSSAKALQRLRQLGTEPGPLADALLCVQSQRLMRRLCPHCRMPRPAGAEEAELFSGAGLQLQGGYLFEPGPAGCARCRGTGFAGRVAVMEVLPVDEAVAGLVRAGAEPAAIEAAARQRGWVDLFRESLRAVAAGDLPLAEALEEQPAWEETFFRHEP